MVLLTFSVHHLSPTEILNPIKTIYLPTHINETILGRMNCPLPWPCMCPGTTEPEMPSQHLCGWCKNACDTPASLTVFSSIMNVNLNLRGRCSGFLGRGGQVYLGGSNKGF